MEKFLSQEVINFTKKNNLKIEKGEDKWNYIVFHIKKWNEILTSWDFNKNSKEKITLNEIRKLIKTSIDIFSSYSDLIKKDTIIELKNIELNLK